MKIPDVPLPLWRDLYEAAMRFKHLRPWETLYDSDIFGIRDPETGDTGYACVLGELGEVFAFCAYTAARRDLKYTVKCKAKNSTRSAVISSPCRTV